MVTSLKSSYIKQWYSLTELRGNFLISSWEFREVFMESKENTPNWEIGDYNNTDDNNTQKIVEDKPSLWADYLDVEAMPGILFLTHTLTLMENRDSRTNLAVQLCQQNDIQHACYSEKIPPLGTVNFARECSMR